MLVDQLFFQIFTLIGSSVICLSLSEIPIWTQQREFGLKGQCHMIFSFKIFFFIDQSLTITLSLILIQYRQFTKTLATKGTMFEYVRIPLVTVMFSQLVVKKTRLPQQWQRKRQQRRNFSGVDDTPATNLLSQKLIQHLFFIYLCEFVKKKFKRTKTQ